VRERRPDKFQSVGRTTLEAWKSGDKRKLAAELAAAAGMDDKPPPGGLERERTELLVAIAADLRAMLAFTCTKGAAVPLRLLQHLTQPEG